ncbi:MAG TPA: hypothetical protein VGA89_01470 [Patescibacteria group bacterium]|jgi:hypothetical protein
MVEKEPRPYIENETAIINSQAFSKDFPELLKKNIKENLPLTSMASWWQ